MPLMELGEKEILCMGQLWKFRVNSGSLELVKLFHGNTEIFKNFLLCLIFYFKIAGTKNED